ncbi:DegT/DnrJ/EryC1/StrS family aminotransferase, partial [Helicobacter typhlonius]
MIPYSRQLIEQDDIDALCSLARSSHLTQGNMTKIFETAICEKSNAQYAITFNSATSALYALYGAFMYKYFPQYLDSKNSQTNTFIEEIYFVTSPISFVATTNMMLQWGIKPIFCDVK